MAQYRNKHWWRPLLRLDIEIPFLRVATDLMNERMESMTLQYIMLRIDLWKWHFDFRLYTTWQMIDSK